MQKTMLCTIIIFLLAPALITGEFSKIGIKLDYNSSIFTGNDIPGKGVSAQGGLALGGFIC